MSNPVKKNSANQNNNNKVAKINTDKDKLIETLLAQINEQQKQIQLLLTQNQKVKGFSVASLQGGGMISKQASLSDPKSGDRNYLLLDISKCEKSLILDYRAEVANIQLFKLKQKELVQQNTKSKQANLSELQRYCQDVLKEINQMKEQLKSKQKKQIDQKVKRPNHSPLFVQFHQTESNTQIENPRERRPGAQSNGSNEEQKKPRDQKGLSKQKQPAKKPPIQKSLEKIRWQQNDRTEQQANMQANQRGRKEAIKKSQNGPSQPKITQDKQEKSPAKEIVKKGSNLKDRVPGFNPNLENGPKSKQFEMGPQMHQVDSVQEAASTLKSVDRSEGVHSQTEEKAETPKEINKMLNSAPYADMLQQSPGTKFAPREAREAKETQEAKQRRKYEWEMELRKDEGEKEKEDKEQKNGKQEKTGSGKKKGKIMFIRH